MAGVFHEVFEEEIRHGKVALEKGLSPKSGFIVSFGLAGEVEGEVVFDMAEETAARIATAMNGGAVHTRDEVTDAVTELMNMVIGKSVTFLNVRGFKFYMTHPATFVGTDIRMRFGDIETLVVPVETSKGNMTINVAIRAREAKPSVEKAPNLTGKTILVVENDLGSQELLLDMLESAGCRVLQAFTAEDGLRMTGQARPHLILMALSLPGMDGLQAVRELKKQPQIQRTPVVSLTTHNYAGEEARCRAAGCAGILTKPVNDKKLWGMVASCLSPGGPVAGLRGNARLPLSLPKW